MKNLLNLNISISKNIKKPFPKFAKLKHRFQVDGKSLLEHAGKPLYPESPNYDIGVPSVIRAMTPTQDDFCYMSYDWQMFSFELIKRHVRQSRPAWTEENISTISKKIFFSTYRDNAFQSNKRGTWTRRDYVNNTNEGMEDIGLQPIFTGGNIVQVLSEKIYRGGTYFYPVKCFNGYNKPPSVEDVNWETHPELCLWATIETRIRINGNEREIRPFSFSGIDRVPFFVIVRDTEVCYINEDRITFVDDESAMSNNPYIVS